MSKITQLNDKAIAVEWAKGATKARIDTSGYLLFEMPEPGINGEYYYDDWKPLEGKWQILGRPEELSREQCEKVMEGYDGSLYVLLKSKGLNLENTLILQKIC